MTASRLEVLVAVSEYLWLHGETDRASDLMRQAILIMLDQQKILPIKRAKPLDRTGKTLRHRTRAPGDQFRH
jgi:hypothetical protein